MEAAAAPLHSWSPLRRTRLNRAFALLYSAAILSLLYHHYLNLTTHHSTTTTATSLSMLLADLVLAFMWVTYQAFRMKPINRETFPENLIKHAKESEFPAVDVLICTADPYKEPPMRVVNTCLSVMAYDYPTQKLSFYVSDDGGSQLTLFAFMEAAKFAAHWLPFCKKNRIVKRCPEAYFASDPTWFSDTDQMQNMYESMKMRVERVVERGSVQADYISTEEELQAFSKWTIRHNIILQLFSRPQFLHLNVEVKLYLLHSFVSSGCISRALAGVLRYLFVLSFGVGDPKVVNTKGNTGGSYMAKPRKPRRCQCCRVVGHTRRTCPQNDHKTGQVGSNLFEEYDDYYPIGTPTPFTPKHPKNNMRPCKTHPVKRRLFVTNVDAYPVQLSKDVNDLRSCDAQIVQNSAFTDVDTSLGVAVGNS
ncbi:unnamed protein product [Camellia sinensis]